jgi:NosR/NirI family nitrous oxide reductase transcriptional regulator
MIGSAQALESVGTWILARFLSVVVLTWFALIGQPARAETPSRLAEFLAKVPASQLIPGADHYDAPEGTPPIASVRAGDRLVGYAFVNADWVDSTGYSGKPILILLGLSVDGKIAGAQLMGHHEPIVLVGVPPERINNFIAGYVGRDVLQLAKAGPEARPVVDIVSGATVTVTVIAESMIHSAIRVARVKGMGGPAIAAGGPARREIDQDHAAPVDWVGLLGDGTVRQLKLTVAEVSEAFARAGDPQAANQPESATPSDAFIDLYLAPVSVPGIGKRLLGESGYETLRQSLAPDQQAILIAANGAYSFKGSGYVRGGIFDRIALLQGDQSIRFRDRDHVRLGDVVTRGAPDFRDVDLFRVPQGIAFDVTQAWRLQLLAVRAYGARDKSFLTFEAGYQLPAAYLKPLPVPSPPTTVSLTAAPERTEPPLWETMWRAKIGQIVVLTAALTLLTGVFFFQDWLAKRPVLYDRLRLGFLTFTLVWIGWYAQAQLSVVNVLAFFDAMRTDFRWQYFLMAPLVFILWFATAASILFWNRGAFCGWLCPFGALQELLNRLARLLKVPQLRVPFFVHSRLVALKYIVFLVLFGISLSDLATAEQAAEVEPFKTAIILHFVRGWPFVLYAGALLIATMTVERSFCRYLCPLGAALAIPARLRMFEWLRRYRECGNPCQRCGNECPVQAIHPEGHINPNECIQCLHCQMLYHHDRLCPVMIQRRLKREKYTASAPPILPPRPKVSAQQAAEGSS